MMGQKDYSSKHFDFESKIWKHFILICINTYILRSLKCTECEAFEVFW